ncbi:MAG: hypothetical protein QW376_08275 [Candidatus Caldarchaeum sp.]
MGIAYESLFPNPAQFSTFHRKKGGGGDFLCGDQVRLTAAELAKLRKHAATHGHVIGEIKTWDDYDEALL